MSITLRNIREDDLEMIMNWRCDPDITKYMNTNPKLTLEDQKKWFKNMKKREDIRNWLIEVDGESAGIICIMNINWRERNTSWGYYIGEKKFRSLKTALSLEMSLYDYVFESLGFEELHNEVFSLNAGVVKLHEACGSYIVKEVKGEIEKEGVAYDITHMSITAEEWKKIKVGKKYEHISFDLGYPIDHIGYAVSNASKAVDEYIRNGYTLLSDLIYDEVRNVNITFLSNKSDGIKIELIEPLDENNDVYKTLKKMNKMSVPYHICYSVDNIERAVREFCSKKYVMTTKVEKAIAMGNRRVVFLLKKDVGLIELVEEDYD